MIKVAMNCFRLTAILSVLCCFDLFATEISFSPIFNTTYTHIIDGQAPNLRNSDAQGELIDTTDFGAWRLNPELIMNIDGAVWKGAWSIKHTNIQQVKSEFEDTSYTNITLSNNFSWWKDRLQLNLTGSRRNQNINVNQGGVNDQLFSNAEFLDVDTFSSSFSFRTNPRAAIQVKASASISDTDFDANELNAPEDQATQSNTTRLLLGGSQTGSVLIAKRANPDQIKASLSHSISRNERDNRGLQQSSNTRVDFGLPIYNEIDFVANGYKTDQDIENTQLTNNQFDVEYYGAGLSWRFGKASFISVTRNRMSQGSERVAQTREQDFTEVRLYWLPSDRTTLEYENSQRFYGESNRLNFSHTAKRWNVTASYNESLQSRTRLNSETLQIPFLEDPNNPGQFFFIPFTRFTIDEELVLNRIGSIQIGYKAKKSSISISYSHNKNEFLERESLLETESFGINFTHKMTRRNTLTLSANQSTRVSAVDNQDRNSNNITASFERRLTRKATGSIQLQKIDSNFNLGGNFNRDDTRLNVKYSYNF